MHYKTRHKLSTANALYTLELQKDKAIGLNIKLPTHEYVRIHLDVPFPPRVNYISLANGGFNMNPNAEIDIMHRAKADIIRVLQNSRNFNHNNDETIDQLIDLIDTMSNRI